MTTRVPPHKLGHATSEPHVAFGHHAELCLKGGYHHHFAKSDSTAADKAHAHHHTTMVCQSTTMARNTDRNRPCLEHYSYCENARQRIDRKHPALSAVSVLVYQIWTLGDYGHKNNEEEEGRAGAKS